jgi:hypothetical protein
LKKIKFYFNKLVLNFNLQNIYLKNKFNSLKIKSNNLNKEKINKIYSIIKRKNLIKYLYLFNHENNYLKQEIAN